MVKVPWLSGFNFSKCSVYNPGMDEREKKSGGAVGCFILGMATFMLLPAYVLSIGPIYWLVEGNPGWEWIKMIYFPIGLVAEYCQPIEDALGWYMGFWIDL
jgi:hypothetical protein